MNKYIVLAVSLALMAVIASPIISDSAAGTAVCPPGTPAGVGEAGVIHLSWTPASVCPTYYVLYWSSVSGTAQGNSGPLYATTYDLTSVKVGGADVSPLPPATTLYFHVGAYYSKTCNWAYSGWSGPISTPNAPDAPTGLTAAYTAGGIALSWNAPASDGGAGIKSYSISRAAVSGEGTYHDSVGNVAAYLDDDVVPGQTYYYTVTAFNGYPGSPSNEANATAGPFAPGAPGGLWVSLGTAGLTLSWDAPSDDGGATITEYRIYRASASGDEELLDTVPGDRLSYADTNISAGETCYYQVSAVNSRGEGPRSEEATSLFVSYPGRPTGLSAEVDGRSIVLRWTAPASDGGSALTHYSVYRTDGTGAEERLADVDAGLAAYVDDEAETGHTYTYRVSASNYLYEGPPSDAAGAYFAVAPGEPLEVVADGGNGQVTVTWSAPSFDGGSEVTGYHIYGGTSPGEEVRLDSVEAGATSWAHEGLANGQTYYYRVTAVNAFGESAPSDEISAVPVHVPSAPTDVSVTGGLRNITVAWNASGTDNGSAVLGYRVYIRDGASFSLSADAGLALSYVFEGLDSSTEYFVAVQAYNLVGNGEISGETAGSTLSPPGSPVAAATSAENWINVTWSAPSSDLPILGYRLYRGTDPNVLEPYRTLGNVTYFKDSSLASGTYYYAVVAFSEAGDGAPSNTVAATLSTVQMTDISNSDDGLWILLALIIIGAALLFLMLLRRRNTE